MSYKSTYTGLQIDSGIKKALLPTTTEATTARTLSASDNGALIYCTNGSDTTITCATGLGAGFSCKIIQGGVGKVTIAAGAATLCSSSGLYATNAQYASISLICPIADTFIMEGTIETSYLMSE